MRELANKIENNYKVNYLIELVNRFLNKFLLIFLICMYIQDKQQKLMENLEEQEKKRERKLKIKGLLDEKDGSETLNASSVNKNSRINIQSSANSRKQSLNYSMYKLSPPITSHFNKPNEYAVNNTPYRLPKLK